jgi:glutamate synthase domain-containing protein 3
MVTIDAKGLHYKVINEMIRKEIKKGVKNIHVINVNGQYYIGAGMKSNNGTRIMIDGVPGNDLAVFMDGPEIIVNNDGQDNIGNTMNSGKIIVHGNAGDVIGYGMRGGKIHIKGDVGYRVGIHMKGYIHKIPVIIVGGRAGDFFGEYMAGGILIILGLDNDNDKPLTGDYLGTGMHGGTIYIRGEVDREKCGKEVGILDLSEDDMVTLKEYLREYCEDFNLDLAKILSKKFKKLIPVSSRPYGNLYAY